MREPRADVAGLAFNNFVHAGSIWSFFFFNDPAPTEIYTLSLHDALPISVLGCLDGQLAGLRAHGASAGESDVSQVRELEHLVRLIADLVLLDEDLKVAGAVAKAEEGCLAHRAQRHHSPGDAIGLALVLFQVGCIVVAVADAHELRGVRNDDAVAVRVDPSLAKERGFLLSQADLIFDRAGRSSLGSVGHGERL